MPGPGPKHKDAGAKTLAETAQQPSAAWQLTLDDHALAEAEGERLATVVGGVKLLAVGEGALRDELRAARVAEE